MIKHSTVLRHCFAVVISLAIAVLWIWVIDGVHDGQTWWSGISSAQQELTFVSEQAFYYYYFKRSIRLDKSLGTIVTELINDDTVEYPTICNAFHRFNIYPELALAVSWRMLTSLGLEIDPLDFYKYSSWGFVGILPFFVYLLSYWISDSLLAACIGPLMMFANFHDTTRAPSGLGLRETIGIPLVFVQFASMLNVISRRDNKHSPVSFSADSLLIVCTTASCLLSWQLCGNLFLLQALSLFGVFAVGHLHGRVALHVLLCHMAALGIALTMLFGNRMLALSWYSCVLVAFIAMTLLLPEPQPPGTHYIARLVRTAFYTVNVLLGAVVFRTALTRVVTMEDDAHIYNLVRAKWGTFEDFHTTIYLRIAAFQGLPWEQYKSLALSGMLSGAFATAILVASKTAFYLGRPHSPVQGFLLLICLAHCLLANLFLRLKFLWTPLLCVMAAILPAELSSLVSSALPRAKGNPQLHHLVPMLVNLLATAALALAPVYSSDRFAEVRRLLAVESTYNREVVLSLVDHIRRRTPPDACIFGDMITTSAVVTMANRRVAIHPHYEGYQIRSKIYRTYHWAARRRLRDVHRIMLEHNITHVVDCPHLCFPQPAPSYAELIEQGEYGNPPPPMKRTKMTCCRAARKPNKYFELLATVADNNSPDENIQFWLYRVVPPSA